MIDSLHSTIVSRIRRWFPAFLTGPNWRVSTWWPSDSRTAMQRSLLRLLSVAHAERLEVTPLVANLAEEHRGTYRRRLRRLALRLADGTPLVDALEQTPEVLRDETVLAIRFANQTGTLEATYRHLVKHHDASSIRSEAIMRQTIFYLFATLLILGLLLSFLMVFIVPTLEHMLDEFGNRPVRSSTLVVACDGRMLEKPGQLLDALDTWHRAHRLSVLVVVVPSFLPTCDCHAVGTQCRESSVGRTLTPAFLRGRSGPPTAGSPLYAGPIPLRQKRSSGLVVCQKRS